MTHARRVAAPLMVVYLLAVAVIVFWPSANFPSSSVNGLWRLLDGMGAPAWITPPVVEAASNVLLFVPLGFLGVMVRPSLGWHGWSTIGLAVSAVIEGAQLLLLPDRSAVVADVVANTVGGVVGAVLVLPVLAGLRRRHPG